MPKAMQYSNGSVIYFAGDKDDRIFILQKGRIVLSSVDIETNATVTECIREGEFFGVKSALGHFPREETASVIADTVCISMTVQEFESLFSSNKQIIMKMLRVFSNQLRKLHKKIELILHDNVEEDQFTGMEAVAKSFFELDEYKTCANVCHRFLQRFPNAPNNKEVAKLYLESKKRAELQAARGIHPKEASKVLNSNASQNPLKQFSLPAFSRFAKHFAPGDVIISEYEPGDSFYLIQSGQVQLVKCVNGKKKNLDILMPSEFFGEMAILENTPRSATCVAIDDVEVLEFNKENFELLITGNPQIALILLKLFCKRIYDQKRRLKNLCLQDKQARVVDVFLIFEEMNAGIIIDERARKYNLTLQDLAQWTGLSIEEVSDEINKFVEKRRVDIFDGYIVVNNIMDIKRFVDQRSYWR